MSRLTTGKISQLRTLAKDKRTTVAEICHTLGISRATFYRYIK
jgi:predicted DNA-binding transcriptional regulator AlpA